jgi:hypothetical protein
MINRLDNYFNGFFEAIRDGEKEAEFKTAVQMILEFGQYIDMLASANPHRFHHVYEWNQVGNQAGRLFELSAVPTAGGTMITYEFLPSTTPNDNGQVFVDKASVMESGQSVTFTTDKPVPIDDQTFRVGSFTFVPGGNDTNGAFREQFMIYFANRTNLITGSSKTMKPSSLTKAGGYKDGMRIYDRIGR